MRHALVHHGPFFTPWVRESKPPGSAHLIGARDRRTELVDGLRMRSMRRQALATEGTSGPLTGGRRFCSPRVLPYHEGYRGALLRWHLEGHLPGGDVEARDLGALHVDPSHGQVGRNQQLQGLLARASQCEA